MVELLNIGIVSLLFSAAALWSGWWTWRFIISPSLQQKNPRELPYLIPVIGHVRSMFQDSNAFFSSAREYFGNTRDIFSITVMGQQIYIATSPKDIQTIYKHPKALDFNPIIRNIMASFGLRPSSLDKMFDETTFTGKSWMDICHENFKLQMHPGEKLEVLQAKFFGNINDLLRWDNIKGSLILPGSGNEEKVVSLYKWCGQVLVESATRAVFGDSLLEGSPNLLDDFFVFDPQSWKLSYQYPYFAAKDMYNAKARGEVAFSKYLGVPKEKREDASWIAKSIEDGIEGLGIDGKDQSSPMLFVLFRLVNTNAYRLCFWCLAHLLHNPELLHEITTEIKPACQPDGSFDISYLLNECPSLASFYEEILRLSNYPIGVRLVNSPTTIGSALLQPGKQLLMPYAQMHFDSSVFGKDVGRFDAKRFMKTGLTTSASFRPFGGGSTQCPGRFLARREIYMFLATLLGRFEIEVVAETGAEVKFPRMDDRIPSGGVMGPVHGDDVLIRVKRKVVRK